MGRIFHAWVIVPILVIRVSAHADGLDVQKFKFSQYVSYQQTIINNNSPIFELLSIPSFRAINVSQPYQTLAKLYNIAPQAQQELENLTHQIAHHVNGTVHSSGLKEKTRAEEKIVGELAGDASKLTDIARITVEVDSVEGLIRVYTELTAAARTQEVINRFQLPKPSGYRDLKVLLMLPESQFIVEVQLHLKGIFEIKNGQEHNIYREIQIIERNAALQDRILSEHEFARIEHLRQQSRALYDNAWQHYQLMNIEV
ncbi:nucleotidyltransferase family protein [Candidatus Enterovibrio altilux]|uniref:Phosphoribosylglycinamide formyltransferase n=1 Tax=Candidatus Enterovibrio altilux TaxID=1927128 RepID=A0A291B9R9_9GAMM|nr:hypothetical protein [Candidatus Enterovibrio luxaltus]ATF09731.1 hypothetical protein BTN50_1243 [Candidatus Enterovibrio luxaltus]